MVIITKPILDKCLLEITEIWLRVFFSLSGIIAKKNPQMLLLSQEQIAPSLSLLITFLNIVKKLRIQPYKPSHLEYGRIHNQL